MTRGFRPSPPFPFPHAFASKSHHCHCFIAFICFIPVLFSPLSLYFLIAIEISERASGVDPFADLLLLRESRRRRRRRGFHLFESESGGLQLRNAFADEIVRPSVMLAASFFPSSSFPSRGDEAIGFPSLLCPPFLPSVLRLCLPSPRTAPSKAAAATAAAAPPFDCPRDKNRAPLFACSKVK